MLDPTIHTQSEVHPTVVLFKNNFYSVSTLIVLIVFLLRSLGSSNRRAFNWWGLLGFCFHLSTLQWHFFHPICALASHSESENRTYICTILREDLQIFRSYSPCFSIVEVKISEDPATFLSPFLICLERMKGEETWVSCIPVTTPPIFQAAALTSHNIF